MATLSSTTKASGYLQSPLLKLTPELAFRFSQCSALKQKIVARAKAPRQEPRIKVQKMIHVSIKTAVQNGKNQDGSGLRFGFSGLGSRAGERRSHS